MDWAKLSISNLTISSRCSKAPKLRGRSGTGTRWMIVPQRRIGQNTSEIAKCAPKTWRYLQTHRELLAKRGSSIYRDKPDFSIFGVGDYSFSPWKVAIAGMYKSCGFVKVGTRDGKPIVFDDTTNFLPCPSEATGRPCALHAPKQDRAGILSRIRLLGCEAAGHHRTPGSPKLTRTRLRAWGITGV